MSQESLPFPRNRSDPLAQSYNPRDVEQGWTDWWTSKNFFTPDITKAKGCDNYQKFIMVIPPPNVTGTLHLGHTLTNAIEDCLTRWHRMQGHLTLWVPGVDHAGIATQSVAERHLYATQGLTRHDLGREKFLDLVWQWKEKYWKEICYQQRRLGISVDWSREAFTMSPSFSRAVVEAFVRLFDAKLIYRDTRLVSWCSHLKTALSDIEVETKEITKPERIRIPGYDKTVEVGVMWYFKYLVKDDPSQSITVATTRIETMLGDVAVAVNDKDSRYAHLIGKELSHPFFSDRKLCVIKDEYVDPDFGTGAVKITPGHDKDDYDVGLRHGLPVISVFTKDGRINENGGDFKGMHRFDCRIAIEERLIQLGLFCEKLPINRPLFLPLCSRSNDIVEYIVIPQWWMNCKSAAKKAVQAVISKELTIVPESFNATWFNWLNDIKDWCISRQLWWGHRIPVYQVIEDGKEDGEEVWVAGRNEAEAHDRAVCLVGHEHFTLQQDNDVLDTWFSSALFPFAVFGWPDDTEDINAFFPTTLLETGHDILFFWVARMVMMSLLLLGKLPFQTVLLHAMVRDSHGKKMSKSLGNVINPIDVIEGITLDSMIASITNTNVSKKEMERSKEALKKDFPKGIPECGTDSLRYGLLAYTCNGRSINLDVNRVVGYRCFCNKLFNATRFVLLHFPEGVHAIGSEMFVNPTTSLGWNEQWILHRLSVCCYKTNQALSTYDFSGAVSVTYSFWLYTLCDVYLELIKPRLMSSDAEDVQYKSILLNVLLICFDRGLRLLHPMLPFITEELYQRLPFEKNSPLKYESITIAPYPLRVISWENPILDEQMDVVSLIVRQFRSLLVQLSVNPKDKTVEGYIRVSRLGDQASHISDVVSVEFLEQQKRNISCLAKLNKIHILDGRDQKTDVRFPKGCIANVVSDAIQIAVDPRSSVDLERVGVMLRKKLDATTKSLDGYYKKLQLQNYREKVPQDVQLQNDDKIKQLELEVCSLQQIQTDLVAILTEV